MSTQLLLIKLALRACERGDTEGAVEALRGVLALDQTPAPARAASAPRAVGVVAFAGQFGYTSKHVHHLIKRGEIPAEAVIGSGRGQGILIEPALEALRAPGSAAPPVVDEIEREGAEYIRRRGRLRVISAPAKREDAADHRAALTTPKRDGRTRRPEHG